METKQCILAVGRLLRATGTTAVALTLAFAAPTSAQAQHAGHDTTSRARRDTSTLSMAGPLGISMERMGSGTTWIPDAVTLPSRHLAVGRWMVMLHGFGFAQ